LTKFQQQQKQQGEKQDAAATTANAKSKRDNGDDYSDDDDEEKSGVSLSLLNIINKVYKDPTAFYDSESLIQTFGSYQLAPIALLGKIFDAIGHTAYSITGFKGLDGKYKPEYTTGYLKGTYKARRRIFNLIPIVSGMQSNYESSLIEKSNNRVY
jgi:hypothetical protein